MAGQLDALKADRNKFNFDGLNPVASVAVDACFRPKEPNAHRWDYFVDIDRNGELYLEVHEVSEEEIGRILSKAKWLRDKIATLQWPHTEGRPLFVAPTKGISPYSLYGDLSRRLALEKIQTVRKGDQLLDLI